MNNDEAKKFMQKANLKYVFFGPEEKLLTKDGSFPTAYIDFLEPISEKESVVLYKIKE